MSERIRQLEEALRSLQSRFSADDHPLLSQEFLLIKKSPELFGVDQQLAFSSAEVQPTKGEAVVLSGRAASASSTREAEVSGSPYTRVQACVSQR